jgi:heat shock protein HtpX
MMLDMTRARRVTFEENRELFRLVENTAIMAGLPTPKIYIIEDDSLNAYATGRNPSKASIALTKGIVEKLEKAELEAVIAHELAHIGNRDSLLMLIVVAGIGCFLFLCALCFRGAGESLLRGKKGSTKNALVLCFIGVMFYVFGYVVAPVLRFALSRRREYQADATAVKITRNPNALARALAKIARDPRSKILAKSSLVGNMCITDPVSYSRLYCTHPPIKDRITALGIDVSAFDMPEYVPISRFSKSAVIGPWWWGAFGTLGFHYFNVYRISAGFGRLFYGLFMWWMVIQLLVFACGKYVRIGLLDLIFTELFYLALLFAPSAYDMVKIKRGTFRDEEGSYIRN